MNRKANSSRRPGSRSAGARKVTTRSGASRVADSSAYRRRPQDARGEHSSQNAARVMKNSPRQVQRAQAQRTQGEQNPKVQSSIAHAEPGRGRAYTAKRKKPPLSVQLLQSLLKSWWRTYQPHIKRFLPGVLISHGVVVAFIAFIAVIIGIVDGFAIVPATMGSLWFLIHGIPVSFRGTTLGVIPLLPILLVIYGYKRRVRHACGTSITVRNIRVLVSLHLLVPIILTCVAWFMLWDASAVFPVAPSSLIEGIGITILVYGVALILGLGPRVWRALLTRWRRPVWIVQSVELALRYLLWVGVAASLVTLVQLAANYSFFLEAYNITNSMGGIIGLTLLAIFYIPNVILASGAVLLGAQFEIGQGAVSLLGVHNVTLPPLPVVAAIPREPLPAGLSIMVLTASASLWAVYRYIRSRTVLESPYSTAGVAAVVAGLIMVGLCWISSGSLGVYGFVGVEAWLAGVLAAIWLLIPAVIYAAVISTQGAKAVIADVKPSRETPSRTPSRDSEQNTPTGDDVPEDTDMDDDEEYEDYDEEDREHEDESISDGGLEHSADHEESEDEKGNRDEDTKSADEVIEREDSSSIKEENDEEERENYQDLDGSDSDGEEEDGEERGENEDLKNPLG